MPRCKKPGCRKFQQRPGQYCRNHSGAISKPAPDRKMPPPTVERHVFVRLFKAGVDVQTEQLVSISQSCYKNVKKYYPEKALASGITGGRNRIDILEWAKCNRGIISKIDMEILRREQQRLSEQITAGIPEFANCVAEGANLICAPATSHSSSGNANGKIHRDCSSSDDEGLLVVELLLDDIRLDNGTVKFWPKSIYVPCEPGNRSRHIARMESKDEYQYLVASAGDIMVWDARILHQSMSNSSRSPSVKLHWFIEGSQQRVSQKGASVLEVDSDPSMGAPSPEDR